MTRRNVVAWLTGAVPLAIGGAGWLWWRRQSPPPPGPRADHPAVGAIYPVADKLYVIPGGGGNTAVFVAQSGVVLVDTKHADRYNAMIEQVKSVTDKPITHVINTHCHDDHAGGNALVPAGVDIVVQENTASNLEKMGGAAPPVPDGRARTVRTFKDRLTLLDGPDAVDLYYFGPAHTAGDAFVVFRAAGVMHAGDVFPGKVAPIVSLAWGGNGATYAGTIARTIAGTSGVSRVISGHGRVFPWDDFVQYGEFNRLLLEHVRSALRAGTDKNQAFSNLHLPDTFRDYKLGRAFDTMDEIDRSIRPWWRRLW